MNDDHLLAERCGVIATVGQWRSLGLTFTHRHIDDGGNGTEIVLDPIIPTTFFNREPLTELDLVTARERSGHTDERALAHLREMLVERQLRREQINATTKLARAGETWAADLKTVIALLREVKLAVQSSAAALKEIKESSSC